MRLDQALVERKLCESRTEAQECIMLGFVTLNNCIITKQTRQVTESDSISISKRRNFVGRGGEKLENALIHIYGSKDAAKSKLQSITALDIGSSTGGFTDCLLQYGVRSVVAVDVGSNQLHASLRANSQVELYESTDIRSFITNKQFDIIVADISFVSLEKLLSTILSFGSQETEYFLLIKPQFEVGKGNTKKGIVKDLELVVIILEKYKELLTMKNLMDIQVFPCALQGGDGNQEYFLYCKSGTQE